MIRKTSYKYVSPRSKEASRRGGSRGIRSAPKKAVWQRELPGWVWLIAGFALGGLLVALSVLDLSGHSTSSDDKEENDKTALQNSEAPAPTTLPSHAKEPAHAAPATPIAPSYEATEEPQTSKKQSAPTTLPILPFKKEGDSLPKSIQGIAPSSPLHGQTEQVALPSPSQAQNNTASKSGNVLPIAKNNKEEAVIPSNENGSPGMVGHKDPAKEEEFYRFYRILPKMEVMVSEQSLTPPANISNLSTNIKQGDVPQVTQAGTYILQVGAFRQDNQAQDLKSRLASIGLSAKVETVTVSQENIWYRVRIGPYTDLKKLNEVRQKLIENKFHVALYKITD